MRLLNHMRWMLIVTALGCCIPMKAAEPDTLARIGAQIEQYPVVRAEFTQTRQMAVMKKPVITTGRLVFLRQHGIIWQIEQPYRVTYLLSEDKIVEIGADGIRKERSQREVPGLSQIGRIFRAMLGANTTALHDYFDVTAHGNAQKWNIDLTPRQPQVARFLTALHIAGGRYVDSIRIIETGGDSTLIRFRNSHGTNKPTNSDVQLFVGKPG